MVCKTVSTNLPSTVGVRGEEKMTTATFEEHQQNKRKRKLIRAKETLLRLMGIALLVSKGVVERLAGVDVQRDLIVKSV